MIVARTKRVRILAKKAFRSKQFVPVDFTYIKARIHPTLVKNVAKNVASIRGVSLNGVKARDLKRMRV